MAVITSGLWCLSQVIQAELQKLSEKAIQFKSRYVCVCGR